MNDKKSFFKLLGGIVAIKIGHSLLFIFYLLYMTHNMFMILIKFGQQINISFSTE